MNYPSNDIAPSWKVQPIPKKRIERRTSRVLPILFLSSLYNNTNRYPRENTHKHPFSRYYVLHYKMQNSPAVHPPRIPNSIICMRDADVLPSNEACHAEGGGSDNGRAIFQKQPLLFILFRLSPYITMQCPPPSLHFILPIYYEVPRRELAFLELPMIIIYIIKRRRNREWEEGNLVFSGSQVLRF